MKIIFGAGIAGLIWAHYHKDYFILTDQVGGQMASSFDLGPRYLHAKSPLIKCFLEELRIPFSERIIKVGYLDDSGWVSNPGLEFRQKYYMKSRKTNSLEGFDSSVMNTNLKEFPVFNIDFREVISRLSEELSERIYLCKIKKVDLLKKQVHAKCFGNDTVFCYDSLVSTIPLNVFSKLSGLDLKLEAYDMTYWLVDSNFHDLLDFDFVYDIRSSSHYHRLTKCSQGIVLDEFGDQQQSDSYFSGAAHIKSNHVLKNSQIISLEKDFSLPDSSVRFVGRYSCWNRRWKTETVIEEALSE